MQSCICDLWRGEYVTINNIKTRKTILSSNLVLVFIGTCVCSGSLPVADRRSAGANAIDLRSLTGIRMGLLPNTLLHTKFPVTSDHDMRILHMHLA